MVKPGIGPLTASPTTGSFQTLVIINDCKSGLSGRFFSRLARQDEITSRLSALNLHYVAVRWLWKQKALSVRALGTKGSTSTCRRSQPCSWLAAHPASAAQWLANPGSVSGCIQLIADHATALTRPQRLLDAIGGVPSRPKIVAAWLSTVICEIWDLVHVSQRPGAGVHAVPLLRTQPWRHSTVDLTTLFQIRVSVHICGEQDQSLFVRSAEYAEGRS
nr:hypothetical protein CFP56_32515 [Quercus suber]